ncbi:MAG: hypothetical protein LBC41_11285 [Clostridiales bacterium]|jgi:hypothetical protein|nr:hypothetical protein [Clostridiales bacterium]
MLLVQPNYEYRTDEMLKSAKIKTLLALVTLAAAILLLSPLRPLILTGRMKAPRVLYGTIKEGMVSASAIARADYFKDGTYFGFMPYDNVHDVLFFPVQWDDLRSREVAIATYNWYYPRWGGASLAAAAGAGLDLEDPSIIEAGGYDMIKDNIKCSIVGDGKYSNGYRLSYYVLYFFPK